MDCELWRTAGRPPIAVAARLRALVPAAATVHATVAEIVSAVRTGGDEALRDLTRRFDTGGGEPPALRVGAEALAGAPAALAPELRAGLELAIANVRRVATASLRDDRVVRFEDGHEVVIREAPVRRAAVYVPGGRAPYPSTVVMGVATARAAGVEEVVVSTPPSRDGQLDATVLAACALAGASAAYQMGGAQAIAALAYGTETIEPVDVIVGPGNLFVQVAKQQVFGQVGIDGFAGPSDLLAIVEGPQHQRALVSDLLAQAEHGPATIVVAVSTDPSLLEGVGERVRAAPDTGALARLVLVASVEEALELAESFAPEHLQLTGAEPEALAARVTRAGCVFVGPAGATAFGDYIAGSNHILPTGGAARFASALSPAAFRRTFTEVRIGTAAGALARAATPIARAEGFEWHARSMEVRMGDNGGQHDSSGR